MAILLSDSYKVINWDLNTKSLDTKYWGKVTDSGRGCKVALLQNGVLKTPSAETMRVNFKKPSGLQIFIDGVISGNYFVFDFTEQVFAEQGEVMAELMLNVGGEWLMSSTFYIQVDQSFTSAIESSEELTALQTALGDVDNFKTQILDVNGNEMLKFSATANAVNEVVIYNNTANQEPGIYSSGNDTNIAFGVHTKGTGNMLIYIGNYLSLIVSGVAGNIVNRFKIYSNISGQAPTLGVEGVDTNIDIVLSPKGTGGVIENKVNFTEATTLANVVSGESNTTLWGKVKKMFSFIGTDISKLASAYSASSTYGTGAYVTYNNKLYRCTTAITVAEAFNIAKWTESNFSEWSSLMVTNSVTKGANINTVTTNVVGKTASQVHINFACSTSSAIATGEVVGIIPVGYRPTVSTSVPCQLINNTTVIGYITFDTNGNITFNGNLQSGGVLVVYASFTTVI